MNKDKPSGLALAGRQLFYVSMPLILFGIVCIGIQCLKVIGLIG